MDKPPEEIYRYMIDGTKGEMGYSNNEPNHPFYNKYIHEDIVEKMKLSAYASAYARAWDNLNKGKK